VTQVPRQWFVPFWRTAVPVPVVHQLLEAVRLADLVDRDVVVPREKR